MKKIIFTLMVLASFSMVHSTSIYSDAGTATYQFLKLELGAKSASMGGAYVGLANSPDGFATNPAALFFNKERGITSTFSPMFAGINGGFIGYYQPISDWRIGSYFNFINYGDMTRTDDYGNELGEFGANDLLFAVTVSKEAKYNISVGLTPKFVYFNVDTFNSYGFAVDLGAMWESKRKRTRIGAAVANMGFQKKGLTESHKDQLPLLGKIGASSKLTGLPLLLSAELSKGIDENFKLKIGGEIIQWKPYFFLRLGWQQRTHIDDEDADNEFFNGMNGGFGINYKKFSVDYAFSSYGTLGNIHRFTINYTDF
ncbi:PorV/PorQ family protein [bacterium]|nr:PorV/PorQ family protein [bacterium]